MTGLSQLARRAAGHPWLFLLMLLAVGASLPVRAEEDAPSIVTYHNHADRSGLFVMPALTWKRAGALHLDPGFHPQISGHVYAQPLYWRAPGSGAGVLLVATEDNAVYALDAKTGGEIWKRSLGLPGRLSSLPCGNIDPLGITGTPVIDERREALYLDAFVVGALGPRHLVFALSLKDGTTLPGWPVDVAVALAAKQQRFEPRVQGERGALIILDGKLYVPFAGHYGDCGQYHGWIVALPLDDPKEILSWSTRGQGGGIWAPGGIASDGQSLFVATGNTLGATSWSDGEAVLRLPPDLHLSGAKPDFFAPSDWRELDRRDADLGGTSPLPLDVATGKGTQKLILALGKDRRAYLLDRTNLGGIGGSLAVATVAARAIRTAPAAYPNADGVFVAFEGEGADCPTRREDNALTILRIRGGSPPSIATAWCGAFTGRGAPIVTTTDGQSNAIVWILGAEGDNRLHGFRGDTGEPLFTSDAMTGLRRFQTLLAAEDRLYVAADGRVYAFGF